MKQTRIHLAADMLKQMGEKEGAVAAALTVGEQSAVPEATNEAMRASGLYHILSISGLHLALAAGIVFFFVRFLLNLVQPLALRINTKKVAAVAALASAFFYLLMAGEPVPAQRSFIMVAFVLLAVLVDRKGISMVSLAWAAGLILLLQPESLVGASFQMSFAATLAIVALYEVYGAKLAPTQEGVMRRVWLFIAAAAITSLVATLATAPFVIHHFNRLQPWGMFANVLVSPLVSFLIMPAVILVFMLTPFGLQGAAYVLLKAGIAGMLWVAEKAAALPLASIALPSLTVWGFVLAALGLIWFCVWQTRIRRFGLALLAIGLLTTLLHKPFDVLMSDDAKQVAVRDAGGDWVMVKGTGRSFVAESWLKGNGQEEPIKAPKGKWNEGQSLKCDDAHCVYSKAGKSVLWLASYKTIAPYCDKEYDAVLASFYLREGECAETPLKIDKASVKQDGAIALRLSKETVEIETAKQQLGARPWVP